MTASRFWNLDAALNDGAEATRPDGKEKRVTPGDEKGAEPLVVGDAPSPASERETGRFVLERDPQTGEWGEWIPVHPAAQPAAPSSSGSHEERKS
jgi:hypothetical protein